VRHQRPPSLPQCSHARKCRAAPEGVHLQRDRIYAPLRPAYLDSAASAQKPKVRAFVNATSVTELFTLGAPELEYSDLVEWPREVLSGSRLDGHRRLPPVRQRSTRRSQLRACASNFSTRHWRAQTSPISALASRVARW
jgi:hypothetical protein